MNHASLMNTLRALGLSLLLLQVGCSDGTGVAPDASQQDGSAQDVAVGDVVQQDMIAPGDQGAQEDVAPSKKTTYLVVLQKLGFTREDPEGIAPGFNLDGRVSDEDDEQSCGIPDYTSPDGEEGIDNQLAFIEPALGIAGLGAAEDLLQSAIEEGGILIMMHVTGVDDLENDPEVQRMIRTGQGVPLLGFCRARPSICTQRAQTVWQRLGTSKMAS